MGYDEKEEAIANERAIDELKERIKQRLDEINNILDNFFL